MHNGKIRLFRVVDPLKWTLNNGKSINFAVFTIQTLYFRIKEYDTNHFTMFSLTVWQLFEIGDLLYNSMLRNAQSDTNGQTRCNLDSVVLIVCVLLSFLKFITYIMSILLLHTIVFISALSKNSWYFLY